MMTTLRIAQFSDCHLFSSIDGLHYGANVYQNLSVVLNDIANDKTLDLAIFTGDLTQDHSILSYQLFMNAVAHSELTIPLYFLSGNHDDTALMERVLMQPSLLSKVPHTHYCINDKIIETPHWQIALLNSKSDTPAGIVDKASLNVIENSLNKTKNTLLCMHHHPIDVGFGIDKHGLINKVEFWQAVKKNITVKGVLCGHVHNAFSLEKTFSNSVGTPIRSVMLFTCPATSVEFNTKENLDSSNASPITEQGAGYQIISLSKQGDITRELKYFPASFYHNDNS